MSPIFTGPIDSFAFDAVEGHVPALGELILTDIEGQHRDDIEYGIQTDYDPAAPEPLRIEAADLDVTGFAGTFDTDHVEVSVPPSWVAVCGTGEQPHVGLWRVKARCTCGASDTQVRLSWHSGEAPFTANVPAQPHATDDGIELDLGLVNIIEMEGDHAWSGRVEVQGDTIDDFEITDILFIPATGYGRVRGSLVQGASAGGLVAADNFNNHTAGAMPGKTAQLGGDWSEDGDTDDFSSSGAFGSGREVQRNALSDTNLNTGQYLRLGVGVATLAEARVDAYMNASSDATVNGRRGVFIRYVDTSNWLMAVYEGITGATEIRRIALYKRVGGTVTELSSNTIVAWLGVWRTLMLAADEDGNAALLEGPQGGSLTWLGGVSADSDLATGGTLDDGGYGIYDAWTAAAGVTRWYDNFSVTAPDGIAEPDRALHPNQSLRLDHCCAQRENAAGTRWGTVPHFEGARLKIPPSTRNDLIHRLVVKQDRNDLTALPVADAGDQLSATLTVTPRVFLTNG